MIFNGYTDSRRSCETQPNRKYVRMSIMYHISSSRFIRFLQSKNTFFHVVFFSVFKKYINELMLCIKKLYRECRKIKEKKEIKYRSLYNENMASLSVLLLVHFIFLGVWRRTNRFVIFLLLLKLTDLNMFVLFVR